MPATSFPLIHLNGSSGDALCDSLRAAVEALENAKDKIADTCPHGRDYPQAGGATTARAEHDNRMIACTLLQNELKDIYRHIRQQQQDRKRQLGQPMPAIDEL